MIKGQAPLIATIVASVIAIALLDLWTSAELVGSILFVFPLGLCVLQKSKRLLWGAAVIAVTLTLIAGMWGF
ncbi:MAG TPA: hypothetical protein PK760_12310, partial [Flavobacteriales bacterium]|nr:hypothetical protein [Flavobacteriales bacterium]